MSLPKLPVYRSHKVVQAAQINDVNGTKLSLDVFGETVFVDVDPALYLRYTPSAGDYFVVYEDGYQSLSPRAAFEGGYTMVTGVSDAAAEAIGAAAQRQALHGREPQGYQD